MATTDRAAMLAEATMNAHQILVKRNIRIA